MSRRSPVCGPEKGAVLFVAVIFSLVIASLMVYLLSTAYQRTRLVDSVGVKRTRNYYRAQAGLVDAFWRIRVNRAVTGGTANFNDPSYTLEYYMDIDANHVTPARTGSSTTKVTIGAKNQTAGSPSYGLRPISAVGLDS